MLVDRITAVLRQHRPRRLRGVEIEECLMGCEYQKDDWPAHVAEAVAEALQLDALHELLHYFSDSPQGWVGEGDEIASEALDVLHGEPVRGELRRAIAAAKAAGWTVAE